MENLTIKVILKTEEELTILSHSANLKKLPKTNEYYLDFNTKEIFKISKIIHEDLHIILIVEKSDFNHKKVYDLIYKR